MAEQRVPAWKRLGLTLKNAKDTAPEPVSSPAANPSTKRSRDENDTPKASKKQRLAQNGANVSSPAPKQLQSVPAVPASVSSPMPSRLRASPEKSSLHTPNTKQSGNRRKSVAFTKDTKTEDGESAQNLFQAWAADELDYYAQKAAEHDAADAQRNPAAYQDHHQSTPEKKTENTLDAGSTPAKPKKESKEEKKKESKEEKKKAKEDKKKAKEEKKAAKLTATNSDTTDEKVPEVPNTPTEKKTKVRTPKTNSKPLPEYVNYLNQYYTSREHWKFNKSKQNDLLKNLFNIYRVPPSVNPALSAYLSGLQGEGAKQRIRQAAQATVIDIVKFIRAEIPEAQGAMEDPAARKAAYNAALKLQEETLRRNGVDPDPERTKRIKEKRDVDERVQTVMGVYGDTATVVKKEAPKPETARARKKKRKSRTDVSDSESSSDDSSDSDSEDEKPAAKKIKTTAKKADIESDSSSSDSDSSSDSESSSDSSSDSSSGSDPESESDDDASSSDDSSSEEDSDSD